MSQFTQPGGVVALTRSADNGYNEIRVADTEVGIDATQFDRIFEPFVQLGTHLTATQGTGLGLAISGGLARGMGGDLTVESVVGVSSTFTLTLALPEESI